jgi:hypothetical protein
MLKRLTSYLLLTAINLICISIAIQASNEAMNSINDDLEFTDKALLIDAEDNKDDNSIARNNLTEQDKFFLIDVLQIECLEIFIFLIATIIHESGHAITTKLLFDTLEPIEMHIGTRTPNYSQRLFSLGIIHFYKIFPWIRGATTPDKLVVRPNRLHYQNIDAITTLAAGGLSVAALTYAFLVAITTYCTYKSNKDLPETILKGFINGTSPFCHIVNTKALSDAQKRLLLNAALVMCFSLLFDLFYGLTPYSDLDYHAGDGLQIWRRFMGVTGTPLQIAHWASIAGVWACWLMALKKYCDARKKISPQDAKMRIPSALIALLLMYYQLVPKE